jgi:hypothetical protein
MMAIRRLVAGAALTLAIALTASSAMATTNVALGATVTDSGTGFGQFSSQWGAGSLAQLATVTDGVFLPEQTQWNTGSVFWIGGAPDTTDYIDVALSGLATIDSFTVQADDNDSYLIQYLDGSNWVDAATIPSVPSYGLVTRSVTLSTPITTSAFRITAGNQAGDGYYGVSEFQAFGSLNGVPEPSTWAMMLIGFGMVGFAVRKRSNVRTAVRFG